MHRESHAGAAVEHSLRECDIVAIEQPRGIGGVKAIEIVIDGKVCVEAMRDIFRRGLIFERDLIENVFARDGIEEIRFPDNRVILSAEAKNLCANFFGFGNAVNAKLTAVVFEQFRQTALNAIIGRLGRTHVQSTV